MSTTIVWFRQDLRLADHPALTAAVAAGEAVVPVYIWSPEETEPWSAGSASRWWLHHSLERLSADLTEMKSRLIIRRGPAVQVLLKLAQETQATRVVWNRQYEPAAITRDRKLKAELQAAGLAVESYSGSLLFEPWNVQTADGRPYQVFTPFWRACVKQGWQATPSPAPTQLTSPTTWPTSLRLADLELLPTIDWSAGFRPVWQPGEAGAHLQLERFLNEALERYTTHRDFPGDWGTCRLSPHLHFGEISPRQIAAEVTRWSDAQRMPSARQQADGYLREIGWREFAYHLLFHFPNTTAQPLREEFAHFPWREDAAQLRAWQRGRTGFPIVDAGMRELWTTGWMHNRVRMIVASFLVKHLRLHWQRGAEWFWDTLVDADLANNTLGWQWAAGCGADAAPYFRIFNPILQGEKFDPEGSYTLKWVPELRSLSLKWLFKPWEAPKRELEQAGIELGRTYPFPLVDHAVARAEALAALESIKKPAETSVALAP